MLALPHLSPALFWDTAPDALDWDAHARYVIERVLTRGTIEARGAAGSVCILTEAELVCCGVGNVEIRCFGGKLPILLSPGVLGARVQKFRICQTELTVDSRLVLFSDGISHRSPFEAMRNLNVEDLCDAVIRQHRKPSDDATVVACDLKV